MSGFTITRPYPHPPDLVWRCLTDSDLLARWLMPNDFAPVVGHRFTFTTTPGPGFDGIVHCEVLELDAPRTLRITWVGGPVDTIVTFALAPDDVGTRLTVTQDGFRGVSAWLVGRMLKLGSRTLYGKRLPALLDELSGGAASAPSGDACMTREQGVLVRTLSLLTRRSER